MNAWPHHAINAEPQPVDTGLLLNVLDAIDYGVIVVDAQHHVVTANRSARATLAAQRFVTEQQHRLSAQHAADQAAFAKALTHAFSGKRAMLALHDGQEAITCAMVPVLPAEYWSHVLVMVSRPQICQPLSVSLFAQHEGLSAAETAVLNGLCNGLEPSEIAQNHGVALNTVRTQILSIRSKTQTGSIRALVQRLSVLPPVLPCLQSAHA